MSEDTSDGFADQPHDAWIGEFVRKWCNNFVLRPKMEADLRERLRTILDWEDVNDEWTGAINEAHPTRSSSHEEYGIAMKMVSHRHSKGALVSLVNWLLVRYECNTAIMRARTKAMNEAHAELASAKARCERYEVALESIGRTARPMTAAFAQGVLAKARAALADETSADRSEETGR